MRFKNGIIDTFRFKAPSFRRVGSGRPAENLISRAGRKIGSGKGVQASQIRTFLELVAHSGGFFFGCAERKPNVFLGGIGIGARQEPRLFFRPPQADFLGIMKEQPTSEELFLFEGFNGRLGQSSSSRLVAPGRSFKF